MQKRIMWVLTGLIAMALLAGCKQEGTKGGGEPITASGPKAITICWAKWAPAEGLQQLGDEFEKETGIKVIVKQIPWTSYQDEVFKDFSNKTTTFDIVVGDSQWLGRGVKDGLYLDLTDWLPKTIDIDSINPQARKYLCEYPAGSGKFYAAPCETDAVGFAYRKDWFEDPKEMAAFKDEYGRELTVPDTWDEFKDIAEFFNRPDDNRFGCVLLTGRGYDSLTMGFQQVMWSYGGSWGDPATFETEGMVNSEASVAALTFFRGLLKYAPKGGQKYDYSNCLDAFTNGSTAMAMDYFAFYPEIVDKMGAKAGFFVMPKKNERKISLGGQGMSISTKTTKEQQELAKQFIAWFLKQENQEKWITKPAGFTANIAILKSDAFLNSKTGPYNAAFSASLDSLQDFWNVPQYNELLAVAQKYLGEALDGVKEPQEALDQIAKEHALIFKDAGLKKP